ncbi:hypothetical protein JHK87_028096 [Glycine soja]|nr:hypothetical protein JHK87_028096 [Glycine soja]
MLSISLALKNIYISMTIALRKFQREVNLNIIVILNVPVIKSDLGSYMNGYNVTHVILGNGESKRVLLTPKVKSVETVKGNEIGVGAIVEVSSDSGAWFAATVVKVVRKDKFLVEYHGLLADDDSQLREEIDVLHIRPHPPDADVDGQFSLLDELDAFYNDGWWVGVISKALADFKIFVSMLDFTPCWKAGQVLEFVAS